MLPLIFLWEPSHPELPSAYHWKWCHPAGRLELEMVAGIKQKADEEAAVSLAV
jgi:hypothetical protein